MSVFKSRAEWSNGGYAPLKPLSLWIQIWPETINRKVDSCFPTSILCFPP